MSVETGTTPPTTPQYGVYEEDEGWGWLTFASVLLVTLAAINVIDGIAAISNAHFYFAGQHYVFGSLNTWGWVSLILGVLQGLVALGVYNRNQVARWTGVALLMLNAIAQLIMMPAYPFWSLCIFALDIVAVYGVVAHGGRRTN